ncbi:MAG: glycoside hydrolase family 9 protein [Lachnospiraceae bacterium]|nr:glycoside hydrolase family 9 protein [Lachnospiraceae bacterium]
MKIRIYGTVAVICLAFAGVTGCNTARPAATQAQVSANSSYGDGITVSNNITPEEDRIYISLAGYEKKGSKQALIESPGEAESFEVISSEGDETVYEGTILYLNDEGSGERTGTCDFSSVENEGSFYIRTDLGAKSGEFEIKEGLYKKLLSDRISYFGETGTEKEELDSDNTGQCILRITDYLLAQEFFPEAISPGAGNDPHIIPRTTLLAKAEVDNLMEFATKDEAIKPQVEKDTGLLYRLAGVFSLTAYEFREYDPEYAMECVDIATEAYRLAEDGYREASETDRKSFDDERYWACAQLYKLLGGKEYREAVHGYAPDIPKGWDKDNFGYLGTVAYLTCYNKIDLNIGEQLITALMEDINAVLKKPETEEISLSEDARLMVLGNYISKNIKYVEGAEDCLARLYGKNLLGKDYAGSPDSGSYDEPQMFILAGLIDSYIYEDKEPEAMEK